MTAGNETVLCVRVQPRASRNELTGWRDGVLSIRLTAPPVDGSANRACREFLAAALGVRRADLELVSGEKSRDKRFRITGMSAEQLAAVLRQRLKPDSEL